MFSKSINVSNFVLYRTVLNYEALGNMAVFPCFLSQMCCLVQNDSVFMRLNISLFFRVLLYNIKVFQSFRYTGYTCNNIHIDESRIE